MLGKGMKVEFQWFPPNPETGHAGFFLASVIHYHGGPCVYQMPRTPVVLRFDPGKYLGLALEDLERAARAHFEQEGFSFDEKDAEPTAPAEATGAATAHVRRRKERRS